eukprot:3400679-Pyramimonas_sp.AAC.1
MPKDAEIASVSYQKQPTLFLKILMGNQVWLTNEGEKEINLPEGFMIAGFGPGKFKEAVTEKDKNHHKFQIDGPDVCIMHGTKVRTVYDMISECGRAESRSHTVNIMRANNIVPVLALTYSDQHLLTYYSSPR